MFSPKQKLTGKVAAIFDIGNGSIGCSLIETHPESRPVVIWTYREPVTLQGEVTSSRLMSVMQKHLKSVAAQIAKSGSIALAKAHAGRPVEALCIFSSPWYLSHTKKVVIEKQKSFTVTERLLNDLIVHEEALFQKASKETSYGEMFAETTAIERKIIQARVNGYQIEHPQGKLARLLEIELYNSLISKELLESVERTIHRALHFAKITYASSALAAFSVIRDLYSAEESFLFFDISAELTEVSAIKHGVLQYVFSFPMGTNSMVRSMSASLKTTHEVAGSLIRLHGAKEADPETAKIVDAGLQKYERDWCAYVRKVFGEISREAGLPERMFLLVDDSYSSFFAKAVEKEKCFQVPGAMPGDDQQFSVILLTINKLKEFVEVKAGEGPAAITTTDILGSLFFNKLYTL